MADYYTTFSPALPLPSAARLSSPGQQIKTLSTGQWLAENAA